MKKVLLVFMTLALLLGCMSSLPVSAESTYQQTTIAVIGSNEYSSLQDAINAATGNTTIEIVQDFSITSLQTADSGKSNAAVLFSGSATQITINGNNHKMTVSGVATSNTIDSINYDTYAFRAAYNKTIVINDFQVEAANTVLYISSTMKMTLNNVCLTGKKVLVQNNNASGYLIANNCTFTATGGHAITEHGIATFNQCNITASSGCFGFYTNGSNAAVVHFHNGSVVSTSNAAVRCESTKAKVYIDGTNIYTKGAASFALQNRGYMEIKNATIIGDDVEYTVNSSTTTADTIIYGGTFIKSNATGTTKSGGVLRADSEGKMTIYGGTFLALGTNNNAVIKFGTGSGTSATVGHVKIYGGAYYQFANNASALSINQNANKCVDLEIYGGTFYVENLSGRNDSYLDGTGTNHIQKLTAENYAKDVTTEKQVDVTINEVNYQKTCKETSFVSSYLVGAQLLEGTTAESISTSIRLMSGVNSLKAFKKVGFVISLTVENPVIGGDNVTNYETTTVYTSVNDGSQIFNAREYEYLVPVEIKNIPQASFNTSINIRPYAVLENDSVIYGVVSSLSVNALVAKGG